jgi:hypothetical protein
MPPIRFSTRTARAFQRASGLRDFVQIGDRGQLTLEGAGNTEVTIYTHSSFCCWPISADTGLGVEAGVAWSEVWANGGVILSTHCNYQLNSIVVDIAIINSTAQLPNIYGGTEEVGDRR